jgi:hypothetical protein
MGPKKEYIKKRIQNEKRNASCVTNDDKFEAKKGAEIGVGFHPYSISLLLY